MQHYQPAMTPMRAGAAQYGVSTPSGPVECKKASAVPAASKVPVAGQLMHAAPAAVPAAVAAAPTPAGSKIQPQLQHLPRFQPPSFEGANGALPCPDSPGSTPREGSEERKQAREALRQMTPVRDEDPPPVKPKRVPYASDVCERPVAPFHVGSIVEYKSRSSGQWILARVEGFDEANQTYRLDVQPHAQPDRVRPRGGGASVEHLAEADDAGHGAAEVHSAARQPPTRILEDSGSHRTEKQHCEAEANTSRLILEVESLRKQVQRLQSENEALQERVIREAALKDQYLSELCACHDQLQRQQRGPHQ